MLVVDDDSLHAERSQLFKYTTRGISEAESWVWNLEVEISKFSPVTNFVEKVLYMKAFVQ